LSIILSACGVAQHQINLNDNFMPQSGTNIKIGLVNNATGQTFDVNVEDMLRDALNEKLKNNNLLSTSGAGHDLILVTKIVEYEQGNAFKRWILPGWGATELSVQSDIMNGNHLVGTIKAKRTVSAGGGYTIGAWKTVFNNIADDIVSDLQSKIPKLSQ
jgi:hypothetical protein